MDRETNRFSANQQIPVILCKLMVHYRFHKTLSPTPFLSQINPAHDPILLPEDPF